MTLDGRSTNRLALDELGVNEATLNGDGSWTLISTVTYPCDEAPAAEGDDG